MFKRLISVTVLIAFAATSVYSPSRAYAAPLLGLPEPGAMLSLSNAYAPALIKGLTLDPKNPFVFDFIIDAGDDKTLSSPNVLIGDPQQERLKAESTKLIKYFLAALTIPEKDLWVNLSPYEKDRTLPQNLAQTEMGRDMLAQDYLLKQITASLIYPEKELGKNFWDKVYAKAQQMYGTTQIPVNTFNKVWIVADKADVFERGQTAFVMGAHLKVMLEEDYVALNKNMSSNTVIPESFSRESSSQAHSVASSIIRDIIIPELEKEVNEGKNFAPLRQMFHSMILASWFKLALKDAVMTQLYGNQNKVGVGVTVDDKEAAKKIYDRYVQAYKKGVFNYIKEESSSVILSEAKDLNTTKTTPRKYFSGGIEAIKPETLDRHTDTAAAMVASKAMGSVVFNVAAAMTSASNSGLFALRLESLSRQFSDARQLKGEALQAALVNLGATMRSLEDQGDDVLGRSAFNVLKEEIERFIATQAADLSKQSSSTGKASRLSAAMTGLKMKNSSSAMLANPNVGMKRVVKSFMEIYAEMVHSIARKREVFQAPFLYSGDNFADTMKSLPTPLIEEMRNVNADWGRALDNLIKYDPSSEYGKDSTKVVPDLFELMDIFIYLSKEKLLNKHPWQPFTDQITFMEFLRSALIFAVAIDASDDPMPEMSWRMDNVNPMSIPALIANEKDRKRARDLFEQYFHTPQVNFDFLLEYDLFTLSPTIGYVSAEMRDRLYKALVHRELSRQVGMAWHNQPAAVESDPEALDDDIKTVVFKKPETVVNRGVNFDEEEWFIRAHKSTLYHDINHSRNVANMAYHLFVKFHFSEDQAFFMYLAGLLHDFDKTRNPNTPARVPATLEQLQRDWDETESLAGVAGESILRQYIVGADKELKFIALKAIIQRSEFPFVDEHPNKAVYGQRSAFEKYVDLLRELKQKSNGDMEMVNFVIKASAIFSEYSDKLSFYVAGEIKDSFAVVRSLAAEINTVVGKEVASVESLRSSSFIGSLGKLEAFKLDYLAAQVLSGPDDAVVPPLAEARKFTPAAEDIRRLSIDGFELSNEGLPSREEIVALLPPVNRLRFEATEAGFQVFEKEYDKFLTERAALKQRIDAGGLPPRQIAALKETYDNFKFDEQRKAAAFEEAVKAAQAKFPDAEGSESTILKAREGLDAISMKQLEPVVADIKRTADAIEQGTDIQSTLNWQVEQKDNPVLSLMRADTKSYRGWSGAVHDAIYYSLVQVGKIFVRFPSATVSKLNRLISDTNGVVLKESPDVVAFKKWFVERDNIQRAVIKRGDLNLETIPQREALASVFQMSLDRVDQVRSLPADAVVFDVMNASWNQLFQHIKSQPRLSDEDKKRYYDFFVLQHVSLASSIISILQADYMEGHMKGKPFNLDNLLLQIHAAWAKDNPNDGLARLKWSEVPEERKQLYWEMASAIIGRSGNSWVMKYMVFKGAERFASTDTSYLRAEDANAAMIAEMGLTKFVQANVGKEFVDPLFLKTVSDTLLAQYKSDIPHFMEMVKTLSNKGINFDKFREIFGVDIRNEEVIIAFVTLTTTEKVSNLIGVGTEIKDEEVRNIFYKAIGRILADPNKAKLEGILNGFVSDVATYGPGISVETITRLVEVSDIYLFIVKPYARALGDFQEKTTIGLSSGENIVSLFSYVVGKREIVFRSVGSTPLDTATSKGLYMLSGNNVKPIELAVEKGADNIWHIKPGQEEAIGRYLVNNKIVYSAAMISGAEADADQPKLTRDVLDLLSNLAKSKQFVNKEARAAIVEQLRGKGLGYAFVASGSADLEAVIDGYINEGLALAGSNEWLGGESMDDIVIIDNSGNVITRGQIKSIAANKPAMHLIRSQETDGLYIVVDAASAAMTTTRVKFSGDEIGSEGHLKEDVLRAFDLIKKNIIIQNVQATNDAWIFEYYPKIPGVDNNRDEIYSIISLILIEIENEIENPRFDDLATDGSSRDDTIFLLPYNNSKGDKNGDNWRRIEALIKTMRQLIIAKEKRLLSWDDAKPKRDAAMSKGGIDLDSNKMGMKVSKEGAGVDITFDPAMVERMKRDGFNGFIPVIINITPVTNILPLLGLAPRKEDEEEKLAGV